MRAISPPVFLDEDIIMRFITVLVVATFSANLAFAHGEDKPGPNGGFIRMPGGFHTEVLPIGKNKLKVFLLDIEWKNPSLKNSSVEIRIESGEKKATGSCAQKDNYYECVFPKGIDLGKKGILFVRAKRESQQGMEINYELPLRLQVIDDGHGNHK